MTYPRNERKKFGRKIPYSEIGIKRIPCFRCGEPSSQQWQICADDNTYRGICAACDIAVNALVIRFMEFPDADRLILRYAEKLREEQVPSEV